MRGNGSAGKGALEKWASAISGSPVSAKFSVFVRHLTWVTVGFGVSRALTVIVNLTAGRLLGPHDFGLYNLGVAIAGGMVPVLSWGMGPANARFASAHGSHARDIHSTAIVIQGILLFFGIVLVLSLRPALVSWLRISEGMFNGALALGAGQAVFLFVVSVSQVESRFRERAVVEALFGFVFGSVFGILFILGTKDYRAILYALSAGYGVVGMGVLFREGARWAGGFSRDWAPRLLGFGAYWIVDMVSFFMQALFLRILTNRFLPASDVGIISLYSLASVSAAVTLSAMFQTVFFPFASGHARRSDLWKRLISISIRFTAPGLIGFALLQALAVWFAGASYPFHLPLLVLMSVASVLCLFQINVGTLLSAQGIRGYRWVAFVRLLTSVVAGAAAYWIIPRWGLVGVAFTYCLVYGSASAVLLFGRGLLDLEKGVAT